MNDLTDHSTGSFVVPQNPSITGFGQRKVKGKPKIVLHYPIETSNNQSCIPKIDVCLRIKPRTNHDPSGHDTLTILSDNIVACSNENARDDVTEYTFSSVFGPDVDQKTFFNTLVYDKVLKFLNGSNELLFAYGTTNSGKTYTIHGNSNNPGMIPRALLLIFNTLKNKLMFQCKYKPDKVIASQILDEDLMRAEEAIRNNILNNWFTEKIQDEKKASTTQFSEDRKIHSFDQLTNNSIAKIFDVLKIDKTPYLDHGDVSYTIWVSYAEIYNESIYDLLVSYTANQKRIPLKLSLDHHKNVYVRDLTHVFVQTAEEAYKVMAFGRNNLIIASNNLNKSSSRSHCIFTIKLMRIGNVESPKTAVISSISFCDLAGSERLKKTMNIGDRLTESKNINTSLLVLNKCFSVLRENQKRGENHLVPCRESKLTQMFQTALTAGNNGTGISMTVNVDMSPCLFEETKQVLFMSAIVRSISKTKATKNDRPRPSFAIWAEKNCKSLCQTKSTQGFINEGDTKTDESIFEDESMISKDDFEVRLQEEQSKLRKELLSQFQKILENNNTFHNKQKESMIKNKTVWYEEKIKRLKVYHLNEIQELKNEKMPNLNSNSNVLKEYHNEDNKNKNEIENYESRIGELEIQNEELLAEIDVLKHLLDMKQKDSQRDINYKNQEIKTYKTMIEEANYEYERLQSDLNEMNSNFDELFEDLEEKNLEIERLTGVLEAKENIITELENQQEELIIEATEENVCHYMDEKIEIIVGLENVIQKLKIKNYKCLEDKSEMAKYCKILKQQLAEKDSKILRIQENLQIVECQSRENQTRVQELKNKINFLRTRFKKPKPGINNHPLSGSRNMPTDNRASSVLFKEK